VTKKILSITAVLVLFAAAVTVMFPKTRVWAQALNGQLLTIGQIPVGTNATSGALGPATAAGTYVGIGAAAISSATVNILAASASSTGTVVNSAASPTADLAEWQINGSTAARIGALGGTAPQIRAKTWFDTNTPDFLGEEFLCSNCLLPFSKCDSSGTAIAQWQNLTSSGTNVNGRAGCGSNN